MGKKSFHIRLAHLLRMNAAACALVVKPQELLHPASVGLDRARSQSPHSARGFVPVKELHALKYAAQELLGSIRAAKFLLTV